MPSDQNSDRLKVLLIGMGTTTLSALKSLMERFHVVGLVRNLSTEADPAVNAATEAGIEVYTDVSLGAVQRLVERLSPGCVVVSSYNRVLPKRLLTVTRFVNVHYSLLPRYRGRANVNWAIINGETHTGISIHELVSGLDAGNILFQKPVAIESADNVTTLYDKLNELQRIHLGQTVKRFCNGYAGIPQNDADATYGCTRLPEDGMIDWTLPADVINNLVRALTSPFPGAFTILKRKRLTIWRTELVPNSPRYIGGVAGRVVSHSKPAGFADVLTGDGVLRILEVQERNGDKKPASSVIDSVKLTLGMRLTDFLEQ